MNDDRTVDADSSTMDELRRLAAEARAAQAHHDSTVAADDATMDELRRFAEEAKRAAPAATTSTETADHTVDADDAAMDELRRYASEARHSPADAEPTVDLPAPSVEPRHEPAPPPLSSIPAQPVVRRSEPVASPPAALDDLTVARGGTERRAVEVPAGPEHAGETWRPPARMVMPTEPEKHTHVHHGPWRTVSIVLAGLVAVLVAWMVFSSLTGGDDVVPTDGTTPEGQIDGTPAVGGTDGG